MDAFRKLGMRAPDPLPWLCTVCKRGFKIKAHEFANLHFRKYCKSNEGTIVNRQQHRRNNDVDSLEVPLREVVLDEIKSDEEFFIFSASENSGEGEEIKESSGCEDAHDDEEKREANSSRAGMRMHSPGIILKIRDEVIALKASGKGVRPAIRQIIKKYPLAKLSFSSVYR